MSMIYDLETNTISTTDTRTATPSARQLERMVYAPRFSHHITDFAGALGMLGIAFIHLLDVKSKLSETPYLGIGYILLIGASLAAAVMLVRGDRRGWVVGAGLAAATFLGYCLSRTTGLPKSTDDIGNWTETLGIYSLIVEAFVVTLGVNRLLPALRSTVRRSAVTA